MWPFRNLGRRDGWGAGAGNPSLGPQKGRARLAWKLRGFQCGPRAPAHLLEAPAVGHGGDHLRELLLLALQHTVHVLGGDLQAERRCGGHPREGQTPLSSPRLLLSPPIPHALRRRGGGAGAAREGGSHVLSTSYVPGTQPAGSLNPSTNPRTHGIFTEAPRGSYLPTAT